MNPKVEKVIKSLSKKILDGHSATLETFDPETISSYIVDDLSFINYVIHGYSRGWSNDYSGHRIISSMMNFSSEYQKNKQNKNIEIIVDARAGWGDRFEEAADGVGIIMSSGYIYDSVEIISAKTEQRLYIPSDTADTPEAYVAAAQKRIDDYYRGTAYEGKISLSYGGELDDEWADSLNTRHFYTLNYGTTSFEVLIYKYDSKLTTPMITTSDINSNILISSDSMIEVESINKADRQDDLTKIGLTDADIFDISLFSTAANYSVSKLNNGTFRVGIPLSNRFNGKKLCVYYIKPDGSIEEHEVYVDNGFAYFETNHFSEYILGTADGTSGVVNPETLDNIQLPIVCFVVFSIAITLIGKKRFSRR